MARPVSAVATEPLECGYLATTAVATVKIASDLRGRHHRPPSG